MKPFKTNGHSSNASSLFPEIQSHIDRLEGSQKDPPIILERDSSISPSDGNDRSFQRPSAKYDDVYWEMGWTDGRLGQPLKSGDEVARRRSEVDHDTLVTGLKSRVAEAQASVDKASETIGSLPSRLKNLRDNQDGLLTERFAKNLDSSLPLGLLYTAVGFTLFIADLPLSLNLVAKGFDIPIRTGDVSVEHFFQNPIDAFTLHWEAIFLAMGIAFSGMFIKYFLDEYVLDRKADATTTDKPQAEPVKPQKHRIMTAILILFLITTTTLGVFRAYNKWNEKRETLAYAAQTTVTPLSTPLLDESEFGFGFYLGAFNFILLTLMFPVVGGVFFSAGWRRLEKAKQYYANMIHIWWLERSYRPLLTELLFAKAQLTKETELLNSATDASAKEALTNLRFSLYKHGYARGYTLPETLHGENRLYPHAKRIVEKLLARNLRTRLWENADLDGS